MTVLTITPLDVLMLRGNRLFGGGVHGGAEMPPWPSVIVGALVSRALADRQKVDDITASPSEAERIIEECLGRDFRLRSLWIMKEGMLWGPAPADLVAMAQPGGGLSLYRMQPRRIASHPVWAGYPLEMLPVLDIPERQKPAGSVWLSFEGWKRHLAGDEPLSSDAATADRFWALDPRLGIALESCSRTVKTGAIYTTDAVALKADARLVAVFHGDNIPSNGLLRLGGDGRAAEIAQPHELDTAALEDFGRPGTGWKGFRMILATPGIFPDGWLPPRVDAHAGFVFTLDGLTAQLVAAAVGRHDVVSGWDLANQAPKPAQKVVPTGSCYWFRVLDGDTAALQGIYENGLWILMDPRHPAYGRKREGWNHVWFADWKEETSHVYA